MTGLVSTDDYKTLFADDLLEILGERDNPSGKSEALINQMEDLVTTFLNSHFARTIEREYPQFSDFQKEHWRKAILWQIHYVIKNGEIHNRSGFEEGRGFIATPEEIEEAKIAPECKEHLVSAGLWNTHIRPRNAFFSGMYGW